MRLGLYACIGGLSLAACSTNPEAPPFRSFWATDGGEVDAREERSASCASARLCDFAGADTWPYIPCAELQSLAHAAPALCGVRGVLRPTPCGDYYVINLYGIDTKESYFYDGTTWQFAGEVGCMAPYDLPGHCSCSAPDPFFVPPTCAPDDGNACAAFPRDAGADASEGGD